MINRLNRFPILARRAGPNGFARPAGLLAAIALLSGCATFRDHNDRVASVYGAFSAGRMDAAAEIVTNSAHQRRKESENDGLLWRLEAGNVLRAAGRFEESNQMFEWAEEAILDFEQRPVISARDGIANVGAIITNENALPYRGNYAERIMVNTYKAMNFLALGDIEAARVEIRRGHERQQQAIQENQAAIDDARRQASTHGLSPSSTFQNPALRELTGPIDRELSPAYANFANPFTTFLSGIVHLADRDPARAEVDFRILASLPRANGFARSEFDCIQAHLEGRGPPVKRRVFVIFENGLGPRREETRIDLILPRIGYTGVAFPRIAFHPARVGALKIGLNGAPPVITERIASMDQIVATEFEQRMPAIVTRTLLSVLAKEIASKQVRDELGDLGLILTSVYKFVVNRADTRTWRTLPKEFQVAVLDYPEDGQVHLRLLGENKNELPRGKAVTLPDASFVFIFAHSVNNSDLRVTVSSIP